MNQYGAQAQKHWQQWLPDRYRTITTPEPFFTELGETAANLIAELQFQLSGPDIPGESYLEKVGRLNAAKMQAEEIVLAEQVLLAPEKTTSYDPELDLEHEESDSATARAQLSQDRISVVEDPTHPYWQRVRAQELDPDFDEQEVHRFVP